MIFFTAKKRILQPAEMSVREGGGEKIAVFFMMIGVQRDRKAPVVEI